MDLRTEAGNGWIEELSASEELVEEFVVDKGLDTEQCDWPSWFLIDDTIADFASCS